MLKSNNISGERIVALLFIYLITSIFHGCAQPAQNGESGRVLRIATDIGRVVIPLANALEKTLPERHLVRIEFRRDLEYLKRLHLLEEGGTDLVLVPADLVYLAYTSGLPDSPKPSANLRGMAILHASPLYFLATESSGIRSLADLRGKRVSIGGQGTLGYRSAGMVLDSIGLSMTEVNAKQISEEVLAESFFAGEIDAAFVLGNDPWPTVLAAIRVPGVTLMDISHNEIRQIRSHHRFMRPIQIPAGVYGNTREVQTIGQDNLLTCRDDLPEELGYWITRTLSQSMPRLCLYLDGLRFMNFENMQASPIPLHAGSSKYYRERELFE